MPPIVILFTAFAIIVCLVALAVAINRFRPIQFRVKKKTVLKRWLLHDLEHDISELIGAAVCIETDSMRVYDLGRRRCIGTVNVLEDGFEFEIK